LSSCGLICALNIILSERGVNLRLVKQLIHLSIADKTAKSGAFRLKNLFNQRRRSREMLTPTFMCVLTGYNNTSKLLQTGDVRCGKTSAHLESDAATRLINIGTGPCFPLRSIPSSFNNIWNYYSKCFQVVKHLDCR